MANTHNDWLGASVISTSFVLLGVTFFWVTSSEAEQWPMAWFRVLAARLLLALVLWAMAVFSNRRKLGLRTSFELGALLLIGAWVFSLGRIFGDVRVAPFLAALKLGSLSTAMFFSGAVIGVIALNIAVKLIRLQAVSRNS